MSRNRLVLGLTGILAFAIGFLLANRMPSQESPIALEETPAFRLPIAAQRLWFPPLEDYLNDGRPMADEQFEDLLSILKERLAAEETSMDFQREAGVYFHSFNRRISIPKLTSDQTDLAMHFMTELEERHPDHRSSIDRQRRRVERLARANGAVQPFSMARHWYPEVEKSASGPAYFSDAEVAELIQILDALLSMPETILDFANEAQRHLWGFESRLQRGHLAPKEVSRISDYLSRIEALHPEMTNLIEQSRFRIEKLSPGSVAPNITGVDLDGVEFELADYRGEIVVLYFTGHWCALSRSEYPYQRLMLEVFENDPVTLLAIHSDQAPEVARSAKEDEGLHFRAWWDGYGAYLPGPIARSWHLAGWPTIYILDEHGVIRYVHKRHLDVIVAVQDLLREYRPSETQLEGSAI